MAQALFGWTEVDSSNVEAVAHDTIHNVLLVKFRPHGSIYSYDDVDHEVYIDLVHAESVGKYFNQAVKGVYQFTKWDNEAELFAGLTARKL